MRCRGRPNHDAACRHAVLSSVHDLARGDQLGPLQFCHVKAGAHPAGQLHGGARGTSEHEAFVQRQSGQAIDLWSVGCIAFELAEMMDPKPAEDKANILLTSHLRMIYTSKTWAPGRVPHSPEASV